jgi:hypothetical protein
VIYLPLIYKDLSNIPDLPTEYTSVADTCVLQGYPSDNVGGVSDMWVGYDDYLAPDGRIVRSLVQFDLSIIPSNVSINQATLNLFLYSSWDFPGRTRTITTYRIGSTWSEMSVNWYSQPSILEAYGSSGVTHGQWQWYSFDVTALVQGWINGTFPNYGLALRGPEHSGSDSSWKAFYTREGSYPPYLQISYGAASSTAQGPTVGEFNPALDGPSMIDLFTTQPVGEKEYLWLGASE